MIVKEKTTTTLHLREKQESAQHYQVHGSVAQKLKPSKEVGLLKLPRLQTRKTFLKNSPKLFYIRGKMK